MNTLPCKRCHDGAKLKHNGGLRDEKDEGVDCDEERLYVS